MDENDKQSSDSIDFLQDKIEIRNQYHIDSMMTLIVSNKIMRFLWLRKKMEKQKMTIQVSINIEYIIYILTGFSL